RANDGAHGVELWKSDGTEPGTVMVKDTRPGPFSGSPGFLTNVNGTLYFIANNGLGQELWKSDGTDPGTVMVMDINPGPSSSNPSNLTPMENGTVIFLANDGLHGFELWKSKGSAADTALVKDINPGPADSMQFNESLPVIYQM